MQILKTEIEGLVVLEPRVFEDSRGKFIKIFNDAFFQQNSLDVEIKESYFSLSNKDVIRGMHFQAPPHAHIKIVYVPHGKILDVVLDLREDSPTYGKFYSLELSDENAKVIIIPKGLAHGFKSLQDNTNVTYMQTTGYAAENDGGVAYNSFGFDWQCDNPQLSARDLSFECFSEFKTSFTRGEY